MRERGIWSIGRLIELMPSEDCGRHLVNVARGGVAVESDIALECLSDGSLTSYATDVFAEEPLRGLFTYLGWRVLGHASRRRGDARSPGRRIIDGRRSSDGRAGGGPAACSGASMASRRQTKTTPGPLSPDAVDDDC